MLCECILLIIMKRNLEKICKGRSCLLVWLKYKIQYLFPRIQIFVLINHNIDILILCEMAYTRVGVNILLIQESVDFCNIVRYMNY